MPAAAAPGVGGSQRGYSLPHAPPPNPPVRATPSTRGIVTSPPQRGFAAPIARVIHSVAKATAAAPHAAAHLRLRP